MFSLLNNFEKDIVQQTTNAAVLGVVNNTIPNNSQQLLETDKTTYTNTASKEMLEYLGINTNNAKYLTVTQQTIIDDAQNAASRIVDAKVNGSLTENNVQQISSYISNEALKYNTSPLGQVANDVNIISDAQATLIKSVTPTTLAYANPTQPPADSTNTNKPDAANDYTSANGTIGLLSSSFNYAQVLNSFPPKAKFTYIVEFIFYSEYDQDVPSNFVSLTKKFDRPEISIEYEEVNYYNFRTNVPKKTNYGPVSVELHDDVQNESMNFVVSYLRRISPLFNQQYTTTLEQNGMNPENSSASYGLYTQYDNTNIIQSINVYHLYNMSNTMDKHTFNNPKIEKVSMSELNMAETDGSTISLSFIYDNYFLNTGIKTDIPNNPLDFPELKALYPDSKTFHGAQYDKKFTNYTNR
jgi:hypothetical protein